MKNKNNINHIFRIPDNGIENTKEKIRRKISIINELSDFPKLKRIKESNSNLFQFPDNYLEGTKFKIRNKYFRSTKKKLILENSSYRKTLLMNLFVKRIAAALILTLIAWFVFKFFLNNQKNSLSKIYLKSYVDTCRTIACIEREEILNELYLEVNEDEMELLN